MTKKISRRDFIKWSGIGAAASVLTGCGPAARYVTRLPYANMPEYNLTGKSTYFATTCRECPAGCGIIVRTMEGRAIKVEGNPNHPVSKGKVCSRGLTSVQGLYNPDRIKKPRHNSQRGGAGFEELDWDSSITTLKEALQNSSGQAAFLLGQDSDHLFDFVTELSAAAGMIAPIRYSATGMMDGLLPLVEAANLVFGKKVYPFFDMANASVVFTFGADFLTSWVSPVAYSRAYSKMRNGDEGQRGKLVSFEPHLTLTSGNADQWLPIVPGSEGLVARAIGNLVAKNLGKTPEEIFADVDVAAVAKTVGISENELQKLANMFSSASHSLAIPGCSDSAGAAAILELNRLVGNLGQPGGLFLSESDPALSSPANIQSLIQKMESGAIKTLFIHGVNPLFDLPQGWGFAQALAKVSQVISFSPFEDETAQGSDYVFPDHTHLESWGYQKYPAGADRLTWSGLQPVVTRLYDTRSTVDVFLAAVAAIGGDLSTKVPYKDEVDFLQTKLTPLLSETGFYAAPEILTFWSQWLQYGGWWQNQAGLQAPPDSALSGVLPAALEPASLSENQLHLIVYATSFGDGSGANRPWLQETPSPLTTGVWGSWVEIHPETASHLGIKDDDIVKVESKAGSVEAPAYLYPAIRPDSIAIPFGQGHTALGRYAKDRGCNPATLLGTDQSSSEEFIFRESVVSITNTGKTKKLARAESREGVYDDKHR